MEEKSQTNSISSEQYFELYPDNLQEKTFNSVNVYTKIEEKNYESN